ncbi:MAG: PEP-CTERM sorting domain-containing protein [Armatimonadota bacterium]|nr:PEP-CTERM sorting domain-containing protein [Armatimonadota bacterium]
MSHTLLWSRRLVWGILSILCMTALLSHASAQFGFDQASGRIDFAHASEGPAAAGAPQFSAAPVAEPRGTLKAPGGGYPTINLATWNDAGGIAAPGMSNYGLVSSSHVGPAPFGEGATTMFAFANPAPGGGSGLLWSRFLVVDKAGDDEWSINSSNMGSAVVYRGQPRTAWAGVFLSVRGSLQQGAVGAASVWGQIKQNGQLIGDPYVVIRSDGAGALPDEVVTGFTSVGAGPFGTVFVNAGNAFFSAWGVQLFQVDLKPGDIFDLFANLTLAVEGPGAKLEVDPDLIPDNVPLPDIGHIAVVPEPSSLAVLSLGLAAAGRCWRKR